MSAVDVLRRERQALCDTLVVVGPDAPTLCEGWLTADLAAHLLARERRPDAGPGLVLGGPFARHLQRVMDGYQAKGYGAMLDQLRAGPPWLFRIGPMAALNVGENWIHHEDVRRANGHGPRPADTELDDILWNGLRTAALMARRRLHDEGLLLRSADGRERTVKDAHPLVTITGAPGELALFMAGRKEAAEVRLDGDHAAVAAVMAAKFGL
jgi:uncharacterized protein (TIGR03085 family)